MLDHQARQWQTPASDSFRSRGGERKDEMGLDQQARMLWRTPDSPSGGGPRNRQESIGQGHQTTIAEQAEHWATPSANEDAAGTVNGKMQQMLTQQAKGWSTPTVQDSDKATKRTRPDHQHNLTADVEAWPTPAARDHKGSMPIGSRDRVSGTLDEAAEQVFPLSHPAPETLPPGGESSESTPTSRRQLNPRFVEWLMGWRLGWTSLAPLDCGSPATGLSQLPQASPSEPSGGNWFTPRVAGDSGKESHGDLSGQVDNWTTPTSGNANGANKARKGGAY